MAPALPKLPASVARHWKLVRFGPTNIEGEYYIMHSANRHMPRDVERCIAKVSLSDTIYCKAIGTYRFIVKRKASTFKNLVYHAQREGVNVERRGRKIEFWRNSHTVGETNTVAEAFAEIDGGAI